MRDKHQILQKQLDMNRLQLAALETQIAGAGELYVTPDKLVARELCLEKITSLESEIAELHNKTIRNYLARIVEVFDRYEDTSTIVFPSLKPGTQKEKKGAKREEERLRIFLENYDPKFSSKNPDTLKPNENALEEELEAFLKKHTRVVLLGEPGTGKSTAFRGLFREYAKRWERDSSAIIPIFAALNQWQENISFIDFLQEEVEEIAQHIPNLLKEGRVLLLLDGLNELPNLNRNEETLEINDPRSKAISKLNLEYPMVLCLLSCRVKEFAGGPGWCDLHVMPLRREQVEAIAHTYFEDESEKAAQLITVLYDDKQKKLRTLAEKPFYLKRLLAYYGLTNKIPENPARLLDYSVGIAIEQEISKGLLKAEKGEALKKQLSQLAYYMTLTKIVSTNQAQVVRWLSHFREDLTLKKQISWIEGEVLARELMKMGENAGFLAIHKSDITFSHQLFQDYFCALHLSKAQLDFPILSGVVGFNFTDIWPILYDLKPGILNELTNLLTTEPIYQRSPVAYALGHIKNLAAVQILLDSYNSENDMVIRSDIIRGLGFAKNVKSVELLFTTLNHSNNLIRYTSAFALGMIRDKRAVKPLILALNDTDRNVRCFAAGALGEIGNSAAIEPLLEILNDNDYYVRGYVIEALGKIGGRSVLPILDNILINQNDDLLNIAAQELWYQANRDKTFDLLVVSLEKEIENMVAKVRDTVLWAIESIKMRNPDEN